MFTKLIGLLLYEVLIGSQHSSAIFNSLVLGTHWELFGVLGSILLLATMRIVVLLCACAVGDYKKWLHFRGVALVTSNFTVVIVLICIYVILI